MGIIAGTKRANWNWGWVGFLWFCARSSSSGSGYALLGSSLGFGAEVRRERKSRDRDDGIRELG